MNRPTDRLTIVTPTYEKHQRQFGAMVDSIRTHCTDLDRLTFHVVVEEHNRERFSALLDAAGVHYRIITTEEVLARFGIEETPGAFLKRVGKFTFQTLKKFGGLAAADTHWSLVLDSEGMFMKPFSALQLLEDYASRKYVFYTRTAPRGPVWNDSLGVHVTRNAAEALDMRAGDRWYMEYFHWFYETDKFLDLIEHKLKPSFFDALRDKSARPHDMFENILYYIYLEKHHGEEYTFYDFKLLLDEMLPPELSRRFALAELPFSLFGNEYLLNILRPEEVGALQPLFDRFRLPFVRLEPPFFTPRYIEALKALPTFVATISSHHLVWLRKKVAVCISGEFRHIVHRTPEQHVRQILGFLSGVDCDIYVHGWSNSSEALIIDQLKPRAYRFEPRPSFAALEGQITFKEPNIKPGRDAGSLAMFYGIEQAFQLAEPNLDEYDVVVRLRPDIYFDRSLKEIMVAISDEGDFLPGTVYVPRHFHSKGINDQFALGPVEQMRVYSTAFSYVSRTVADQVFNPETMMLRNLLAHGVEVATVDVPYALMRQEPLRLPAMTHALHHQEHVWWSRTDPLPLYEPLSDYFADKLRSMDSVLKDKLGRVAFLDLRGLPGGGEDVLVRCAAEDNNPARNTQSFYERGSAFTVGPFLLRKGRVEKVRGAPRNHVFLFKHGDDYRVAQWINEDGRWRRETLDVPAARVSFGRSPYPVRMRLASEWRQMLQRLRVPRVLAHAYTKARRSLLAPR